MGPVAQPAREVLVRNGLARLYVRDVGHGWPIVVVHGGPDFNHEYLLPELDRLSDSARLVYYDQRGRGRSFNGERADDVTIDSEVEDLDAVRRWIGVTPVALLGHSWGGLLAITYALRHATELSHLILMNTAPLSRAGALATRRELDRRRTPEQTQTMKDVASSSSYRAGDLDADTAYYRIHFGTALYRADLLDSLLGRLRVGFSAEGIVRAREIEEALYEQTWRSPKYDLTPQLEGLRIPTLVIHGDNDIIPVEVAEHVASAIPGARLTVLPNCGHFAYLDQLDQVHRNVAEFITTN